jgi:hypothetical protein
VVKKVQIMESESPLENTSVYLGKGVLKRLHDSAAHPRRRHGNQAVAPLQGALPLAVDARHGWLHYHYTSTTIGRKTGL